ncbi:GGDEF domain-containing protein [Chitinibacteraceae bacterium HSL-7]
MWKWLRTPITFKRADGSPQRLVLAALLLCVSTLGLLVWHHLGMQRVWQLDLSDASAFQAIDDSASGGLTRSKVFQAADGIGVDCTISLVYEWPYCELSVALPSPENFSHYDELFIRASYEGPAERLRLYLRNFNPAYSKPDEPISNKINQITFAPSKHPQGLTANLGYLAVPEWWLDGQQIELEHSRPEFNHVVAFELATSETPKAGHYRIVLHQLELRGKWFTEAEVMRIIVAQWLLGALVFLTAEWLRMQRAYRSARRRTRELVALNEELVQRGERLADQAERDPLTGVLNRAGGSARMLDWVDRSTEPAQPLSLVFIDLDHFKQVNDRYGHAAGDAVLKEFATLVEAHVRRNDFVVRWGGEEFVLVLPGARLDVALRVAEKLRERVAGHIWPEVEQMTASFGVAQLGTGERLQTCIARADAALYLAKQQGRNQVVPADPPANR